ncbi:MAG: hypothetical protein ACRD4E_06535 [Bryobacteraceae bacterium]
MNLTFAEDKSVIGVPYKPADRGNDRPNLGYLDLKRKPELIPSVPELRGVPELLSLIQELNHSRSLFRSLSCEWSMGPNMGNAIINTKLTSFVRLCFEILEWNGAIENYRTLYDRLEQYVATLKPISDLTSVEFVVDFASYNDHNYRGRALTLWHHGYGRNEAEARKNWGLSVIPTERFFAIQREAFEGELDKGHKTIS